jgi:3-phosphoshikimate 1-carboxyvinyltransferase
LKPAGDALPTARHDPLLIAPLTRAVDARMRVPGSKSLSNRHLVLAALADAPTRLVGLLACDDCDRLLAALAELGVAHQRESRANGDANGDASGDVVVLTPPPRGVGEVSAYKETRVNLGDGGTPTRFMLALAAAQHDGWCDIDGSARMRERPIAEGVDMLRALGARVEYLEAEGRLPVRVFGRSTRDGRDEGRDERSNDGLRGGELRVGRTASSQFVSALMLVAPTLPKGLEIEFTEEPTSATYIQLSLGALQAAGVDAEVAYRPVEASSPDTGLASIRIRPQTIRGGTVDIEPDASSAVYLAALAAISGGDVVLEGLPRRSLQPDALFFDDLALRGARIEETPNGVRVRGRVQGKLRGLDSDYARAPDAAVMAMVLAAACDGPSRITGLGTLRVKESDRIEAVAKGLRALGGVVETGDDWVRVHPLPPIVGALASTVIDTVNDHRIAMAFAVLGLVRPGISIANPRCVEKSWPRYWETLDLLRGAVSRENGQR